MNSKFKIIFVCTENIGRSLIAEYCLKKYLADNKIDYFEVESAGTDRTDSDISNHCFAHFEELGKMGINISKHKRKPLTQEMVDGADLIVVMADHHQDWVKEKFNVHAPLFKEIVEDDRISIRIPPPKDPLCETTLRNLVHYMYESMPKLVEKIRKEII